MMSQPPAQRIRQEAQGHPSTRTQRVKSKSRSTWGGNDSKSTRAADQAQRSRIDRTKDNTTGATQRQRHRTTKERRSSGEGG